MEGRLVMGSQVVGSQVLGCVREAALFQHPLLEDPASTLVQDRAATRVLQERAERICLECPIRSGCLYRAVVDYDVAGYVAASTEQQRHRIRRILGIRVPVAALSAWIGDMNSPTPNRHVATEEVVRACQAHPDEPLPRIAQRLGCSLTSVKRHLRIHRTTPAAPVTPPPAVPTVETVLDAWEQART